MADDRDDSQKTEQPTPKRLEEARRKGDVVKSQEVAGVVVLAAGAFLLSGMGGSVSEGVALRLERYFANASAYDIGVLASRRFWLDLILGVGGVLAVPAAILVLAAAGAHIVQTGPMVSAERLKPKLSKLSPLSGVKRVFGMGAAANFAKGLAKLTIVGSAVVATLWPRREELRGLVGADAAVILPLAREVALSLLLAAIVVYALLAAADYLGQHHAFMKRQRMTRQEIKDEHKQSEGDPQVRARLRQIRQERANRRMMTKVPSATVVVTNPTHYAVALKYERGETAAPLCLAKGVDAVALRIREVAEEHDVPIVEDPALARSLFAAVELDREISPEHYEAVAKIIGYVLTLSQRRDRRPR